MKKIVLLFGLCVLSLLTIAQENSKRVLFIGNSYTEYNNLPHLVQQLAESANKTMEVASNTPGGSTFLHHCSNASMTMIKEGNWDVVVLQEQSQMPSFPQNQVEQEVFPYAAQLVDSIRRYNPEAVPMFYMTWGRKNGDERNAEYFPILGTYEGMDSMLYVRYMYMAATNNAEVCPVGRVWRYLRTNNPTIELYQADGSHPSQAGSYAAACAFVTMIWGIDPLTITSNYELDSTTAQTIREATHTVVFNQLDRWQHPSPVLGIQRAPKAEIVCYPNPTHGHMVVNGDYVVVNTLGQTIVKGSNNIDLTQSPNGVYIVKVYNNGEYLGSQKIIKQ